VEQSRERIASASEVRRHFGATLKAVAEGETIIVTQRGKHVAAHVPFAEYAQLVELSEQERRAGGGPAAG
jgi:prevent-host-death family protein